MRKSSLKSTELWFSVAAFIAGAIMAATGAEGGVAQILGGVMMSLSPAAYTAGRSSIKKSEASGAAQVQAARELAKKPEPGA
jgi:predicted phage tail protein